MIKCGLWCPKHSGSSLENKSHALKLWTQLLLNLYSISCIEQGVGQGLKATMKQPKQSLAVVLALHVQYHKLAGHSHTFCASETAISPWAGLCPCCGTCPCNQAPLLLMSLPFSQQTAVRWGVGAWSHCTFGRGTRCALLNSSRSIHHHLCLQKPYT
jgi:hypothetical protein